MQFKEMCSISGKSGLYQLISTKSDGAIVKNIDDQTTTFIAARSHQVTPLDSIEVYTLEENVRLREVFESFKENEKALEGFDLSKADNKTILKIFAQLFPSFDKDRIYTSDMKKMIRWYGILKKHNLLEAEEKEASE
ncbi:MAG: DUF5606 domain-containing protein [Chitinophagaceae bacterium]